MMDFAAEARRHISAMADRKAEMLDSHFADESIDRDDMGLHGRIEDAKCAVIAAALEAAYRAGSADLEQSQAEVARLTQQMADWDEWAAKGIDLQDRSSVSGLIARLTRELEEARKDTARLDWLELELEENRYHMDVALQSDEEDGVWFAKFYRREIGVIHGSGLINRKCSSGHWGPIPPPSSHNRITAVAFACVPWYSFLLGT